MIAIIHHGRNLCRGQFGGIHLYNASSLHAIKSFSHDSGSKESFRDLGEISEEFYKLSKLRTNELRGARITAFADRMHLARETEPNYKTIFNLYMGCRSATIQHSSEEVFIDLVAYFTHKYQGEVDSKIISVMMTGVGALRSKVSSKLILLKVVDHQIARSTSSLGAQAVSSSLY